jgi:hypothetical protein
LVEESKFNLNELRLKRKSANEKYKKYASLYKPSFNLSYVPQTINYEKIKENKQLRDEEERLKEEQRNRRIQEYLQMKPRNLIDYPTLPKPIYKPSKLASRRSI